MDDYKINQYIIKKSYKEMQKKNKEFINKREKLRLKQKKLFYQSINFIKDRNNKIQQQSQRKSVKNKYGRLLTQQGHYRLKKPRTNSKKMIQNINKIIHNKSAEKFKINTEQSNINKLNKMYFQNIFIKMPINTINKNYLSLRSSKSAILSKILAFHVNQNKLSEWNIFSIKGSKLFNQDSYFIKRNQEIQIYGICDGHGQNGHLISCQVAKILPKFLQKYCVSKKSKSKIEQLIKYSFTLTINYLKENKYVQYEFSGCTACVIIIKSIFFLIDNKIYCANVGDSRAIIYSKNGRIQVISVQHKPTIKQQKYRIQSYGGKVKNQKGIYRVWNSNCNGIGLALSRTIGDFNANQYGIIGQPDITKFIINSDIKYIIIGSDGLFQLLKFNVIRNLCIQIKFENLCQKLCQFSKKEWFTKCNYCDDITCLCIKLE